MGAWWSGWGVSRRRILRAWNAARHIHYYYYTPQSPPPILPRHTYQIRRSAPPLPPHRTPSSSHHHRNAAPPPLPARAVHCHRPPTLPALLSDRQPAHHTRRLRSKRDPNPPRRRPRPRSRAQTKNASAEPANAVESQPASSRTRHGGPAL